MSDRDLNTTRRGSDRALGIPGLVVPGKPAEDSALAGLARTVFERSDGVNSAFQSFAASSSPESLSALKASLSSALCEAYEGVSGVRLVYSIPRTGEFRPEDLRDVRRLAGQVVADGELQKTATLIQTFGGGDAVRRLLHQVAKRGVAVSEE